MATREYNYDDFKANTYAYKPITATGYADSRDHFDINSSSILTTLIQEAGRYCESFASDLFIDWQRVLETIDAARPGDLQVSFLFGFRQNGVDHDSFIFSRFNQYDYHAKHEYRSLWRLDITFPGREIVMKLGRVF